MRTGQSDGCSGQLAVLPTSTRMSQPRLPVRKASVFVFFFFFSNSLHIFSVARQRSSLKILEEIPLTWKIAATDIFPQLSSKPPGGSCRIHKFEEPQNGQRN